MKEVCDLCDMTYDTLKFYCNKGLIPNVKRDKNNYRVFSKHDVDWINRYRLSSVLISKKMRIK
ncbi:MerR family DNA-binding transcriptional regulator [Lactococcus cremoris]